MRITVATEIDMQSMICSQVLKRYHLGYEIHKDFFFFLPYKCHKSFLIYATLRQSDIQYLSRPRNRNFVTEEINNCGMIAQKITEQIHCSIIKIKII